MNEPMPYLTTAPIEWDQIASMAQEASQDGCGAVVIFTGVVRADRVGEQTVQALCYEAYTEMAERLLQRYVERAKAAWPLTRVHLQHRLGVVETGQISVVAIVAARHRAEAYAGSRFLIERIKHDVPIWKQEYAYAHV